MEGKKQNILRSLIDWLELGEFIIETLVRIMTCSIHKNKPNFKGLTLLLECFIEPKYTTCGLENVKCYPIGPSLGYTKDTNTMRVEHWSPTLDIFLFNPCSVVNFWIARFNCSFMSRTVRQVYKYLQILCSRVRARLILATRIWCGSLGKWYVSNIKTYKPLEGKDKSRNPRIRYYSILAATRLKLEFNPSNERTGHCKG